MALGTPYSVCGGSAAAGVAATLQVTVGTGITGALGTGQGHAIVVAVSGNTANSLPSAVTDSQGNAYALAVVDTNRIPSVGIWYALNAAPLVSGTDTITASFSGSSQTSGAKELIARACSGVMAANALDAAVSNDAGAVPPAVTSGSTGPLQQASEWAVAAITDQFAGGVPSSWTGGFTAVSTQGAGPFLTLADQVVSSAAALTAGATIVSSKWECALITLQGVGLLPPIIRPPLSAAVHRASWW